MTGLETPRTGTESEPVLRRFRSTFIRFNAVLVLAAAGSAAVVNYMHRDVVEPWEIVVVAALVFGVMPGIVFLLYRRFRAALTVALREQARADRAVARQQFVLGRILESLIDPVLSIDEQGIVLTANPAVATVFGWKPEEIIGGNVNNLMGEPYRSAHDDYLQAYLSTGKAKAIGRVRKVIGRRKSGEEFPCELSVSELLHPEGRRFVGVVRDVAEREEMAARLAQAERLAAVGELAAGVAHEINNPVNTIINCAQLLEDGDDDPQTRADIIGEGMRIASIVRDLLDFSRDRREEHVPTRIEEVVRRTVPLIAGRLEKLRIALEVAMPQDLPLVRARSQQLQQVLLNLLLNAKDALESDPRGQEKKIEIRARERHGVGGRFLSLVVRDNGPGIPPENLTRVFHPFFTTKRETGGTGLGLAVSHGIIEEHGGTLTARSRQGEYSEFELSLPVVAPSA